MKIYLIGMPLSGKSTIGKYLAEELEFDFVDLDDYIEKTYEVNIEQMLINGHEDLFRAIETEALIECSTLDDDTVVATGGGIVLNEENNNFFDGPVVFLDVSLDVLKEREKKAKKRPLLKEKDALTKTYNKRIELYYNFADIIIVETDIEKIIDIIIDSIYEEGFL